MSLSKTYYGTKKVSAWPESRLQGSEPLLKVPDDTAGAMPGYAVQYHDGGYVSWSPKDVFERAYQPIDAMSFGHAIQAMKEGHQVSRAGWNGKGMWLCLASGGNFREQGEQGRIMGDLEPFIYMRTAQENFVPWLASQTDMLANDWGIVP